VPKHVVVFARLSTFVSALVTELSLKKLQISARSAQIFADLASLFSCWISLVFPDLTRKKGDLRSPQTADKGLDVDPGL